MRIWDILKAALPLWITGNSPAFSEAGIDLEHLPPSPPVSNIYQNSFWVQSQTLIPNTTAEESASIFAVLSKLLDCDYIHRIETTERDEETLDKLFARQETNSTPLVINLEDLLTEEKLYALINLLFSKEEDLLFKLKVAGIRGPNYINPEEIRQAKNSYLQTAGKRKVFFAFYDRESGKTAVFELCTNLMFALESTPGRHQRWLEVLRDFSVDSKGQSRGAYTSYVAEPFHLWRHTAYRRTLPRGTSTTETSTSSHEQTLRKLLGENISYDIQGLTEFIGFQCGASSNPNYSGYLINEAAARAIVLDERRKELILSNPTNFPDIMDIYNRALTELSL